ncbi:E3 ubiquitin-protein ligase UPL5-like [Panicum miliaceum]|uniref:HECT-type E3 ubiquitin transferase n=1 Tax=Panicum miliaceum TaxID=4540 RepID=A0A3L6RMT1_PANMI|nr:E3 ubiquitin-protein ligase UPL5-like [Panicum miliaceum]
MLIDRSRLLPDSFGYIAQSTPQELGAGLSVAFKHEQATGPGVLREWVLLGVPGAVQPAPSSVVDPLHLGYFEFAGRMIALALMHKIHVGVFFDRTLFLRLTGRPITLDDIADTDPSLHKSCKQILEMDPSLVDSNVLGLTFVREVEVLGSRTVRELNPGGKDIVVTSQNRDTYISLLIQDRFINSTRRQLSYFIRRFSSFFDRGELGAKFFESLDAADFDQMLGGGSNDTIDVKEWREPVLTTVDTKKRIAKSNGSGRYAVENMTVEQQRRLLFFWTSVKYLPSDGFSGLGCSKLLILRASSSRDHLPTSQTCFYHLNLPDYTSSSMMQSRLRMIVQEHVSSGFGVS